jgi:DNA-binding transcriptional MerR regulator
MTATPRVLSYQAKNALGEDAFAAIADMSDEETFGPEFHRMSFAEAIEADPPILSDYKIVVVGVSDRQVHRHIEQRTYLEDASADQVATSLALQKVMKKHGLAHALTFHSRVKRAKSFTELHKKRTRNTDVEHVNGSMSTNDRLVLLDEFKKAPLAVMTNARCLTEGVDVPAIDCVAFVDPKHSKVDIVQAAGRALRLPKGDDQKPYGVILIPIFYEVGEDPERIAASGVFKNVFEVVRAMADQDERLQAEITNIRLGLGKRHPSGSSRVNIDFGEERLVLTGFEQKLREALVECVVERTVSTLETRIEKLRRFYQSHGHYNPADDKELRRFVSRVRYKYRQGALSAAAIQALESFGFPWDVSAGLIGPKELGRLLNLTRTTISQYVRLGVLVPSARAGNRQYFDTESLDDYRAALGITLDSTEGLLSEPEFAKLLGMGDSRVGTLRKKGKLVSAGFASNGKKIAAFYHPKAAAQWRKDRGITLRSTEGLLSVAEFAERVAISKGHVSQMLKKGEISCAGYAQSTRGVSAFFRPSEAERIRRSRGVTLEDTTGLVSEAEVRKMPGLSNVSKWRLAGEIVPAGFARTGGAMKKVGAYYTPKQVAAFKKKSRPKRRTNITAKQALRIYRDPRTHAAVARAHDLSPATVTNIKLGKSWAHVTGHKAGAAE